MVDAQPLVVIGAGLPRTGTSSLRVALEKLLQSKCYHMFYVVSGGQSHVDFWNNACVEDPGDEAWRRHLSDYRGAVDYPASGFYQRLMDIYPEAKVVLTVREAEGWVRSINTIVSYLKSLTDQSEAEKDIRHFRELNSRLFRRSFGEDVDFSDTAKMVEKFHQHTENVKKNVESDRLLVFDAKEGWEPLCHFLNLPVPEEPYPMVNSTEQFNERRK